MTRMLLICGGLLLGVSATAQPVNNIPQFVNGHAQAIAVCENSVSNQIDTALAVNDADAGQTETWIILNAPVNGTVGGFVTSATSTGSTIYPAGLTYTPTAGFAGPDSFTVQIFDGFDTATTKVVVNIKELPTLSTSLAADTICNADTFSYAPASLFTGATFAWTRLFTGGISNPVSSGMNNPMEILNNTTYYTLPVTYTYTITANGCSNTQNVVVNVNPTPTLTINRIDTICSGGTFTYTPTSPLTGTTFAWTRASVTGITPATASGTGSISEMLVNSSTATQTTTYAYTLSAGGCAGTGNVMVAVSPQPNIAAIASTTGTVCSGTNNQVFSATTAPATGVSYHWSAVNATIVATGKTGQYSIVDFPKAGMATIKLTATIGSSGCMSATSVDVNVSSSVAPTGKVVYFDQQFMYLDNTVGSYQWGYDDAATLAATEITGQVFQTYPISAPDMNNKMYWVKTSKGGCTQKTYYNNILAVANVNGDVASLSVFPNPATSTVTVSLNGARGETTVTLVNMMGQTMKSWTGATRDMEFNVADLPSGCYMINCALNGEKVAATRFIKN